MSPPAPYSVVVVTWNSARELPALFGSARRHLARQPEWIVVDNGSSDDTLDIAADLMPEARVMALGENRGFSGANNIGVRQASGDVVVLLNPDVELVDGSLDGLAALAASTGALCGGRLLNPDGSSQISAHPAVGSGWALATAFLPWQAMPRGLRRRCVPWRVDERLEVGWLSGACLAARRTVLTALGPFDERLHLFGEDIDLGVRAATLGVPRIYAPDVCRVIHEGGRSTVQRFTDDGLLRKVTARRWVARERLGAARAAGDLGCEVLIHGTRLAAKMVLRRPADYEKGWFQALRASSTARTPAGEA